MAATSKLVTVQSRYHHQTLTSGLWNFFTTKYQVDLDVATHGGGMVYAHQLILDVFLPPEKQDRNALSDQRSNLHALLKFIYTGTIQVETEELDDLLWLGRELDFQMLVDAVESTMADGGSGCAGGGNDHQDSCTKPTKARARRKKNSVQLRTSSRKRNPVQMHMDDVDNLPVDSVCQDKVNLASRKRVRPVLLLTDDNSDSPTAIQDLHLAQHHVEESCSTEDDKNDKCDGNSSDESFDPEDEDEAWSGENEKEMQEDENPHPSTKMTGSRKRRCTLDKTADEVDETNEGDETEESTTTPGTTAARCERQREYIRNHPVIRCKLKPCTFRSRSKNSHQVHLATAHASGAQLFPCPTCSKPFLDEALMKRHHHVVHSKASGEIDCSVEFHQCPHCDYKTRYQALYEAHRIRRHGESNAVIYRCDMCSKVFLRSEAFERHKLSHKPYNCAHCEFETTRKGVYTHHLFSVHQVNEKGAPVEKLQCPECDYKGKDQCTLRYHIASQHTFDKPYKCLSPQCQQTFVRKSDRDRHNKIAHLKQRNYMCEFCSFRAVTPYNLELHRRTHTGERPFQCETCSKKFGDRYSLKKHTKLHTSNEKPFLCHLCSFACNRRDNLRTHLKGVHKNQIATLS